MGDQVEKKGANSWKWFLAIGLTGLCVMVVAVSVLVAVVFKKGKPQLARVFEQTLLAEGNSKIPADRLALLRELCELAKRKEMSLPAVVMLTSAGNSALDDHKVSDQEQKNLILVRDFVKSAGGAVNYKAMGEFSYAHPQLKLKIEHKNIVAPPAPDSSAATTQTQEK